MWILSMVGCFLKLNIPPKMRLAIIYRVCIRSMCNYASTLLAVTHNALCKFMELAEARFVINGAAPSSFKRIIWPNTIYLITEG